MRQRRVTKPRLAFLVVFLVAVAAFFAFGGHEALSFQNVKARYHDLEAIYQAHPLWTMVAFFALYIALATTSLPGGAVLTMIAGALFGLFLGTVLVSFASTLGAVFAMLLSRYVLRDWVERRFGARLRRLNEGVEREGALYLFMLRLVPAIPFFLVNVGMGLTRLGTWRYYWVSQLGMLPGSVLFANAGTKLAEMNSPDDVLTPGVIGAFVLLAIVPITVKKIVERVRKKRTGSEPAL